MVNSTIDAMSLNVAIDTLTASKLKIIEIRPVKFQPFGFIKNLRAGVAQECRADDPANWAPCCAPALNMARGLEVLYSQEDDPVLRPVLMNMLHDVRTGSSLSWAMAKHPRGVRHRVHLHGQGGRDHG